MRRLNEDNNYSILRNPSPYRIGRAPGAEMNADEKLKSLYLMRRAEEVATFQEQLRCVGQMDNVKPMIADLYRDITTVRNFIEQQQNEPIATEKHLKTMEEMVSKFDEMNKILTNEIIPLCDELGVSSEDKDETPLDKLLGTQPTVQVRL